MPPTPVYAWPLLKQRLGCEVFVKHENHTPTGAFKIRGGLVYMDVLQRCAARPAGVITATRGNHGQSIALAGARTGIPVTVLVPRGNSAEKNLAMRAFGAHLVEFGADFEEAKHEAARRAVTDDLQPVPAFDRHLIRGVATYALELFRAVPALDVVYVPIGMGSGICGLIAARDLLGLKTEIVGVVAARAPAVALSFEKGQIITTERALTFADGMACREPHEDALRAMRAGAARILTVSEQEIATAIRVLYQDTHNLAEGAGAAALAGLMQEQATKDLGRTAVILTGGNIDMSVFADVLAGKTPEVAD